MRVCVSSRRVTSPQKQNRLRRQNTEQNAVAGRGTVRCARRRTRRGPRGIRLVAARRPHPPRAGVRALSAYPPRREVCGPPQSNPCRSSHVPSTLPHEQNSTTIPRPVASGQPSAPEPVAHEHPLLSVSQTDVSALAHTAHIHSAHIQRGTSRDEPVTAPGFGLRRTADNTASSDILLPAAPSSLGISHPMQHAAR